MCVIARMLKRAEIQKSLDCKDTLSIVQVDYQFHYINFFQVTHPNTYAGNEKG